jgi:hypothetical protein
MKLVVYVTLLISFFSSLPKLSEVREDYINAAGNKEVATKLYDLLLEVSSTDEKVYVAYKGASCTMMAKFTKTKNEKKVLFKEGMGLIEFAVSEAPENIEIRIIRLSIQENVPKFLKYNSSIEEDKQFVLDNYKKVTSKSVQSFVRSYVMQSDTFSESEKGLF